MFHAQLLQQRGELLFNGRARQRGVVLVALQLQHGADVFLDGELAKDRRFLRQIRQPQPRAAMDGHVRHRLAIDADVPAIAAHQAHDHVERSGLASAIGAEQTHHFAFLHDQRNVLHHLAAAVGLGQVSDFQAAGGCARGSGLRGTITHWLPPPKELLGRSAGPEAGAAGAAAPAAGSLGASTARTRPLPVWPSAEGVAFFCPSTVNTSVRLL